MRRANHDAQSNVGDKAYEGVCRTAALLFGPLLIRRWEDDFVNRLIEEREYLRRFDRLGDESSRRLTALDDLLERRRRYG